MAAEVCKPGLEKGVVRGQNGGTFLRVKMSDNEISLTLISILQNESVRKQQGKKFFSKMNQSLFQGMVVTQGWKSIFPFIILYQVMESFELKTI